MAPAGRGPVTQGHLESHKVRSAPAISHHSPPSHPADTSSLQGRHFHLHPHQMMGTGIRAACTLLSFYIPKCPHCPNPKLGAWQGSTPLLCFFPVPPTNLLMGVPIPTLAALTHGVK